MTAREILETIQRKPRLTPTMIAEELDMIPGVVRNILSTLSELGLVNTPARGVYEISPLGSHVLEKGKAGTR